MSLPATDAQVDRIAVVGMAGRLPGAPDLAAFWANLRAGVESVTFSAKDDLLADGYDLVQIDDPHFVPAHGMLDAAAMFDAAFFGYPPREAQLIDPQHRVFLESAYHALEDANLDPTQFNGRVGVFAGAGLNTYFLHNVLTRPDLVETVGPAQVVLSSDKDYLATRVAYKIGLTGLSISVQTACSTSLVAVHLACQSLLSYQCDAVIAGGVRVSSPRRGGYRYLPGGVASIDGHCRAYDAAAHGTVGGDGAGAVVLKRLEDAEAAGDTVHAVILASACNNDGSTKAGFTAPSVRAQADVISEAMELAGVGARTISYVEGHGTATALGDPVEVAALTRAFRRHTDERQFCALGTVKTNIGHLDTAAGIAGLLKTVLALRHRELPASLHFTEPHPAIDLAGSPFYVNRRLSSWTTDGTPLRAGVSSFGLGGTNVHVILEEAPPRLPTPAPPVHRPELILVSAHTRTALAAASAALADRIAHDPDLDLCDLAHTTRVGRRTLPWRRAVLAANREQAVAALSSAELTAAEAIGPEALGRPVFFMFPGIATIRPRLGQDLYERYPTYRAAIDECATVLADQLGLDLREVLFAEPDRAEATEQLTRNLFSVPAIVATEYALSRLLATWGVRPLAMIGYSVGEYTAACLSGVLTLRDCLTLVALRGRLFDLLPAGGMVAVNLPADAVRATLPPSLEVAGINSPSSCTVSGPLSEVQRLIADLEERGVPCVALPTRVAAHSAMVDDVCDEYRRACGAVRFGSPETPYVSSVTGDWVDGALVGDVEHWLRHLRQPVQFAAGVRRLADRAAGVFVEVGPGHGLTSLVRQQGAPLTAVSTLGGRADTDVAGLVEALGQLWSAGASVDWEAMAEGRRQRVTLPGYPFERQEYWVEPGTAPATGRRPAPGGADMSRWFSAPAWRPAPRVSAAGPRPDGERWLVFADDGPISRAVVHRIAEAGATVTEVVPGTGFAPVGNQRYTIDPDRPGDYAQLLTALAEQRRFPEQVLHLWAADPPDGDESTLTGSAAVAAFESAQPRGFYSLLFLAQALESSLVDRPLPIRVVGAGLHSVVGTELLSTWAATVLGACRVIPQENANLPCQVIDLDIVPLTPQAAARAADQVIDECAELSPLAVAYRGGRRWRPTFEPVALPEPDRDPFRRGGSYLITGGADEYAEAFAGHLSGTYHAHVTFVERPAVPAEAGWDRWLDTHPTQDPIAERIRRILRLRESGGSIHVITADVASPSDLRRAILEAREQVGHLHGVLHTAGLAEERVHHLVRDTSRSVCQEMFRRRAHGTIALTTAVEDVPLDFCLVQSTLSTQLGGLGRIASAAAARFAELWVEQARRAGRTRWFTTDWDDGEYEVAAERDTRLGPRFTPEQAVEVIRRVVGMREPSHLVVLADDLQPRIDYWLYGKDLGSRRTTAQSTHPRPTLATAYEPPRNEIEQQVADIWQELLGVDKVGIEDDFFSLGGHSLLGVQLVSRLRTAFGVDFPLRSLFEAPTVAGMAQQVVQIQAMRADVGQLESVLAELELLDDDIDAADKGDQ